MEDKALFTEKQYLGRDHRNMSIRLLSALICLMVYSMDEDAEASVVFLLVGCSIIFVSVVLMFMVHFRTTVLNNSLVLDGLWTTRKVKIDLGSIQSVEVVEYSKYMINNPVYNLHRKGCIRFYASGKYAVKLTDKEGLVYYIGSQQCGELSKVLQKMVHA